MEMPKVIKYFFIIFLLSILSFIILAVTGVVSIGWLFFSNL